MVNNNNRILVVDDEEAMRLMLVSGLAAEGYAVESAQDGVEAINAVQAKSFDAALLDITMPKVDGTEVLKFFKEYCPAMEVIMATSVDDVKTAVECMKMGAYDYVLKPNSLEQIRGIVQRALERKQLLRENALMKRDLSRFLESSEIVGESLALRKVLSLALRVAPTESTILIQGASGTGKELVASFIHKNSSRAKHPFVALNCASIPDSLIESELFGHEKGAFTSAIAMKQGLVEMANGATLFLDEVGDISPVVQPKLLRFVQTGEFRRVGGNRVLKSDVRIISATNKNLAGEVGAGRFREDLLYRLDVIKLEIPSLRDRKDDIPLLAEQFLRRIPNGKYEARLSPAALEVLLAYDWPGNVRELENVIERATILCDKNVIQPDDLSLPVKVAALSSVSTGENAIGNLIPLRQVERMHIEGVLTSTGGNKPRTSKVLGISLKTLYTKLSEYHVK